MSILENVDPWLKIQGVFDASFRTLFPHSGLCRRLGFTGISERLSDPPGWFLWIAEPPGAYSFELIDARLLRSNAPGACIGAFAIRFFPSLNDRRMLWLSAEERGLRAGPCFDATGTPGFQAMGRVGGGLFLAGFLDVAWHLGSDSHEFRLREAESDRTGLRNPCPALPAWHRERRREQAWQSAWALTDKLLLAFGLHQRASPLRAAVQHDAEGPRGRNRELVVHYRGPSTGPECVFTLRLDAHVAGDPHAGLCSPLTERWLNWAWWHAPDMKPGKDDAAQPECACMGSHG